MLDTQPIQFLLVPAGGSQTQREIELARSSARSHVAKLTHKRRRIEAQLNSQARGPKLDLHTTTSRSSAIADVLSQTLLSDQLIDHGLNSPQNSRHPSHSDSGANSPDECSGPWQGSMLHRTQYLLDRQAVTCTAAVHEPLWAGRDSGSPVNSISSLPARHVPDSCAWQSMSECPGVLSPGSDLGIGNAYVAWAYLTSPSPAIFHALMWQIAIGVSFFTDVPITDPTSLWHHHCALQSISHEISGPLRLVSELTMCAMLSLSIPEPSLQACASRAVFHSPFASLGWLSVLGREPMLVAHTDALYQLVEVKGGINNLHMDSLASNVAYMDIVCSSQNLTRPRLDFPERFKFALTSDARLHDRDYSTQVADVAVCPPQRHSISQLTKLVQHGLNQCLSEALQDLRAWCRILDSHVAAKVVDPNSAPSMLQRDFVQHKILCIVFSEQYFEACCTDVRSLDCDQHHKKSVSDLDKLMRLDLLILTLGVTFPITYVRPFTILSQQLQQSIETVLDEVLISCLHHFLTWSCMLGCLAALHAQQSDLVVFFINTLARIETDTIYSSTTTRLHAPQVDDNTCPSPLSNLHRIRSWNQVKEDSLMPFLWHIKSCDDSAQQIWNEVQTRLESRKNDP